MADEERLAGFNALGPALRKMVRVLLKTLDRLLERLDGRRSEGEINLDRSVQWRSRRRSIAIPAAQKAKYP